MSEDTEYVNDSTAAIVVPQAAIAVLPPTDNLGALVKDADQGIYKAMSGLESLDWKNLKPNQTAVLLMQRPMAVSGGGTMYLNLRQALYFAVRAYELGVSPFSSAVWFDPAKFSVNLTLEGKREVARLRGIDLGPPSFKEITREWADIPKMTDTAEEAKKAGFTKDVAIECSMRVGDPRHNERANYTAWLSEWFQPKSPLWKSKPIHMLTTRAQEKCITSVLGTGASTMPDEKDLD